MTMRYAPLTWEAASDAALRRAGAPIQESKKFTRFVRQMAEAEGVLIPHIPYAQRAIAPFLRVGQHIGVCDVGSYSPSP